MSQQQRLDYTHKPTYWRMRAEETRAIAEQMTVPECRERLLRVADEYDAMADCLEHTLRDLLGLNTPVPGMADNVTALRPG